MGFRVKLDLARCIGCLACTRCENFICGNDFKARAVRSEVAEIGCNREAAAVCPVGAISISDPNPCHRKPETGDTSSAKAYRHRRHPGYQRT